MYSSKQLKAIDPANIVGCSTKHIQSVIEELVATSLALAEENKKKDRLLSDEAVTVLKLIRRPVNISVEAAVRCAACGNQLNVGYKVSNKGIQLDIYPCARCRRELVERTTIAYDEKRRKQE